jgi:hypothetical protein
MEYVTALYRVFFNLKISDRAALGDWPPFAENVVFCVQSGNLSSSLPNEATVPDLTHQSDVVACGSVRFPRDFRDLSAVNRAARHNIITLICTS